ncbi:phospholipase A2 inhibitor and Ly6/PLAUR domain-containing protein-like [Thamnophis elegans]|uniref:phospholipase A2 inhibitor and Ly6/PLAUR domain-containing protein-like n=1 Tax=Thamnophis elegans TaxID=35005 RepID=UPI001378CF72|nr:phospholipase A2 inhibitor and Ly6/PLAUR domain-containing protein-like [Thamnophis elegans]
MRAAGILVLCLFSSILSTVTSLKCQQCVNVGIECKEENVKVVECKEDEEFCSTVLGNSSIAKIPVSSIIKECATREACWDGLYSTTTVDGRFNIARGNCCQTDLCNAEPLPLENYEDFQPNGLQCPGCFALDEDSCEANQSVACVGEQDLCITITHKTVAEFPPLGSFSEKTTHQGCTTKSSCSFRPGYSKMAGGLIHMNVTILECRNASSSEPDHQ